MRPPVRGILLSTISFGLGACVGWFSRSPVLNNSPAPIPMLASSPPKVAATIPAVATTERASKAMPPVSVAMDRLKAYAWLKRTQPYLSLPLFGGDGLDPTFVALFDLSPSEAASLELATRRAKDQLLDLARQVAKVDVDRSHGKVTVDVPSMPGKGGQIYDQLLAVFGTALGPEKFQQFNALEGDVFDRSFDSFGVAKKKYEVTVRVDQRGQTWFDVRTSSSEPNSSITSNGSVSPQDLTKAFPPLDGIVPADFSSVPSPPSN